MQVFIYVLLLTKSEFEHTNLLLEHISLERQNRIKRYYNRNDQLLSMYAELIVRMGINQHYHINVSSQKFKKEENGKPYLVDWPEVHFNLSHSKRCVLCAISSQRLGVDVEKVENAPFEIMSRFFHKDEIAYINDAKENQLGYRFFEVWTRKEAYVKYDGKGLGIDLVRVNTMKQKTYNQYFTLGIDDNYILSVFAEKKFKPFIVYLTEQNVYDFFRRVKMFE